MLVCCFVFTTVDDDPLAFAVVDTEFPYRFVLALPFALAVEFAVVFPLERDMLPEEVLVPTSSLSPI